MDSPKQARNGPSGEAQRKSAYISAPSCVDTFPIRKALEAKGVYPFSPDELDLPGRSLTQILHEAIRRADLVVAVVDPTPASSFVFFEVGFAQALEKPTLLLLMAGASPSTWVSSGIPYVRFDPVQFTGLDLALAQVLAAPHHGSKSPPSQAKHTHPLGNRADELLRELRARADSIREVELEEIVARAIRESGATSVSQDGPGDRHIDLAVWSEDLSPWVGNPLAVEFRRDIRNGADLNAVVGQFMRSMASADMPWGLLIYLRSPIDVNNAVAVPNVVAISAEGLLESLRTTGFGQLVRRLRNQRVHGGS
ncbi:MAG TPA: nucleoside 2-deoxyribosyltransferase [Gemmataceae bacterium]|nr:nucleoside 2-deoxyribosyltransferase [Gemmataceae bacterium]